ncbi:hypothetical protein BC834DRAFT_428866 [Gloeopeniophorella convolvens]|nr:hypothetical protein BC834DRAFT_428866 [Gloeopeniophorella convolvens]
MVQLARLNSRSRSPKGGSARTLHTALGASQTQSRHPGAPKIGRTKRKLKSAQLKPVLLRSRLTLEDLNALRVIWERDKRIPSSESRRQWALQRGISPGTVGSWFFRRRARYDKMYGQGLRRRTRTTSALTRHPLPCPSSLMAAQKPPPFRLLSL